MASPPPKTTSNDWMGQMNPCPGVIVNMSEAETSSAPSTPSPPSTDNNREVRPFYGDAALMKPCNLSSGTFYMAVLRRARLWTQVPEDDATDQGGEQSGAERHWWLIKGFITFLLGPGIFAVAHISDTRPNPGSVAVYQVGDGKRTVNRQAGSTSASVQVTTQD